MKFNVFMGSGMISVDVLKHLKNQQHAVSDLKSTQSAAVMGSGMISPAVIKHVNGQKQ